MVAALVNAGYIFKFNEKTTQTGRPALLKLFFVAGAGTSAMGTISAAGRSTLLFVFN